MHHKFPNPRTRLPIALCHTLQLVLLLDGVRVAASLGGVDKLLSQALSNALDVAERGLAGTDGEESDGLVYAAEGRHIDGLTTDGTGGTNTGGVFAGSAVNDSVNGNLDGVLVGHDVDLKPGQYRYSKVREKIQFPSQSLSENIPCVVVTYDLESVSNNADSHELLSVVTAVHHERVGEALNDGALSLPEALDGITAGGV